VFEKSDGMQLSQVTNPLILLLISTLYVIEKGINTFINSVCTSSTFFLSFVKERECGVPAYIHAYFLTLWSRALLQLLTGFKLIRFPAFYGTHRIITALTSAHHLSLS